jgi:hypothetical protein
VIRYIRGRNVKLGEALRVSPGIMRSDINTRAVGAADRVIALSDGTALSKELLVEVEEEDYQSGIIEADGDVGRGSR